MRLDGVLRVLEESRGRAGAERRHPGSYWWRVLGDPGGDGPWLLRVSGHHVAVHARVVGDRVSGTPSFLGADPARVPVQVPDGPPPGYRTLPAEQLLGHALLASLDADQRAVAVVAPQPPPDLATRHDPLADPAAVPRGVRHDALDAGQARLLELLVRHHLDRLPPALAGSAWRALVDEGLGGVTFAWQGGAGGAVAGAPVLLRGARGVVPAGARLRPEPRQPRARRLARRPLGLGARRAGRAPPGAPHR